MQAQTITLPLPATLNDAVLADKLQVDTLADQYQKTYQFIRRAAQPVGFVNHPQAVIKCYHMERETEALPDNLVNHLSAFIMGEIDRGHVNATQGVGFAILSQGFLSINVWGRGNVLFTYTYTVEGSFPELSPKPLEKTGVACTWEILIMQYEYAAWQQYLQTEMTIVDKRQYLQNFIAGKLYPMP